MFIRLLNVLPCPDRYAVQMHGDKLNVYKRSLPDLFIFTIVILMISMAYLTIVLDFSYFSGIVAFLLLAPTYFLTLGISLFVTAYIGFYFSTFKNSKKINIYNYFNYKVHSVNLKPESLTEDQWQDMLANMMVNGKTNKDDFKVFTYKDSIKINMLFCEDEISRDKERKHEKKNKKIVKTLTKKNMKIAKKNNDLLNKKKAEDKFESFINTRFEKNKVQ